jgi:glucosamine--fructose-6-phosphate aminotransferase (isomerizing)
MSPAPAWRSDDAEGRQVHREMVRIAAQAAQVDKAGHKHFMAKEIFEQPTVLAQCLAHYVRDGEVQLPDVEVDFAGTDRLIMVACGTAYYACLVAKYWFEQLAGLPCDVDIASEFRYREPPVSAQSTALFVSQSGETADTLAALRYARARRDTVVSLVNVPEIVDRAGKRHWRCRSLRGWRSAWPPPRRS